MVRKILGAKEPKLRKVSKPVAKIDSKIKELIRDLKDTLKVQVDPEGVGLAAPQIGKNLRVFVTSYKGFERVVINPKIIKEEKVSKKEVNKEAEVMKKKKEEILEGCLSLPNYYGPIKRVPSVTVKYLNEEGKEVIEEFKGFNAQIIMHEIDHLNGYLFIDRLLEQKKPLYKLNKGEWEEIELI